MQIAELFLMMFLGIAYSVKGFLNLTKLLLIKMSPNFQDWLGKPQKKQVLFLMAGREIKEGGVVKALP